MVSSLTRKLPITKPQFFNPNRFLHKLESQTLPNPSIPPQQKLIETKLFHLLDKSNHINQVKQVHAHIVQHNLDQSCYLLNKLIRILTNLSVPLESYQRLVFERVKHPNPFLWTSVIRGYSIQGPISESVSLYNTMRKMGISPVSFTFTALLKACGEREDAIFGMQIHGQIVSIGGFCEDLYVGNSMIDMYVKCGLLELGRKVFDEMADRDVISWTSLIVAYARRGDLEAAGELFDELPVKDMVAWTAMVTGFAQNARPRESLEFFGRMERAGVRMDEITLIGVISACAQLGATKHADWIRHIAERSGFGHANNVFVGSAMVDMYSKCGSIEEAFKVFEGMRIRNVFSYSSMIVGFAIHGLATEAIDLFEKMVKTEIKPNRVTFVGVLTACSHAGLVEQGRYYFEIMEKHYDVTPMAEHYACMVDLLGRSGQLEEALALIKTMPMEPNVFVWGALLGACRIHRNADIAEIAASHLFELEPDEVGNYMLLSTIYASTRRWEDVSGVRKLMRTKGLKKNAARSWVEGEKGVIHEFFAGEMNVHPNATKINQSLDDLLYRLQLNGYKPNLDSVPYDVNDEVKKKILMRHSEKLALACGLVSSSDGGTIRIVKNLRICDDCHLFMCSASQVTGKEIIIRDNMRFHHFSNGYCSCGDFW